MHQRGVWSFRVLDSVYRGTSSQARHLEYYLLASAKVNSHACKKYCSHFSVSMVLMVASHCVALGWESTSLIQAAVDCLAKNSKRKVAIFFRIESVSLRAQPARLAALTFF
jgi:hypothetical protein